MPEVDRATMLRVLAEKGVGWTIGCDFTLDADACIRRRDDSIWDPFACSRFGWSAAGELLVAMRQNPQKVWWRFAAAFYRLIGRKETLESLSPALIAQAAFEALVWEKKEVK